MPVGVCEPRQRARDPPTGHVHHEREFGPPGREQHLAEMDARLPANGFGFVERHDRLRRTSAVIDETSVPVIDLLKIGGRRAELDALRGIESRHWPRIQQITMEVHEEGGHATEGRLAAVLALLSENGFHVTITGPEMPTGTGRFAVQAVRPSYADDPRPILAANGPSRPLRADFIRARLAELLPPEDVPDRVVVVSSAG